MSSHCFWVILAPVSMHNFENPIVAMQVMEPCLQGGSSNVQKRFSAGVNCHGASEINKVLTACVS